MIFCLAWTYYFSAAGRVKFTATMRHFFTATRARVGVLGMGGGGGTKGGRRGERTKRREEKNRSRERKREARGGASSVCHSAATSITNSTLLRYAELNSLASTNFRCIRNVIPEAAHVLKSKKYGRNGRDATEMSCGPEQCTVKHRMTRKQSVFSPNARQMSAKKCQNL